MPYMNGKVDMGSYKADLAAKRAKKKRVAKPVGSRVQSPDQQEKTMMMGKQPVAVFPRLKGQR